MPKTMLEIWAGGGKDKDPLYKVPLDRESRQFLHVRLNNIELTYDENGIETRTDNYYPFINCTP